MNIVDLSPAVITTRIVLITIAIIGLLAVGAAVTANFMGYRLGKAEQKVETTTDGKVAVEQAAKGNDDIRAQKDRLDIVVHQAQDTAHAYEVEARRAPDAEEPLPQNSIDRLRGNDDVLCGLRPALCEGRGDVGAAPGPAGS